MKHNIDMTEVQKIDYSPFTHLVKADNLYIASKLENHQQLDYLKDLDLSVAIDMKLKDETDFDDEKEITKLGIEYVYFPIESIEDVSFEQLEKLYEILSCDKTKKLVYCMSGNRVGALLALTQSFLGGHPKKRSLEFGQKTGLTRDSLIERVKNILERGL